MPGFDSQLCCLLTLGIWPRTHFFESQYSTLKMRMVVFTIMGFVNIKWSYRFKRYITVSVSNEHSQSDRCGNHTYHLGNFGDKYLTSRGTESRSKTVECYWKAGKELLSVCEQDLGVTSWELLPESPWVHICHIIMPSLPLHVISSKT